MRRKSERNKAKQASPEKKIEKPTRKSTRRRTKKSPSTSPERDVINDTEGLQTSDKEPSYKIQTRLHNKEIENIIGEPETKVSSTETITDQQDVIEDSGSVWKAARADASPGEIPKLKLCRQRNLSETSDVSLNRKRTNKWQETGGEGGVAEEDDSADERPATSSKTIASNEPADNPSSTIPGRDSGEEVSDSKEFPPENASADLSDDKPNIDRHDDTNETTNCTAITSVDNEPPVVSDTVAEIVKTSDSEAIGEQQQNEESIDPDVKIEPEAKQANAEGKTEIQAPEAETTRDSEQQSGDEPKVEEKVVVDKPEKVESESESAAYVGERIESELGITAVIEPEVEQELTTIAIVKGKVGKELKMASVKEKEEGEGAEVSVRKDATSSDDEEERKKPIVERLAYSDNSDDESSGNAKRTTRASTRAGRRKHRDKYRDSSNSSVDSDDEPTRVEKEIEEPNQAPKDLQVEEEAKEQTEKTAELKLMTSSIPNDSAAEVVDDEVSNEKPKSDNLMEKMDHATSASGGSTQAVKPVKINLKRSFASRVSVDGLDQKKENTEMNDATQDKENHVSGDQVESNIIPKRRRWGTAASTEVTPTFSISTDFLKTLVPGAKPLSISEVRLSKDDDEERNRRRDREKRYVVTDGPMERSKEDNDLAKNDVSKGDNHIATRRKISIVKETSHTKSLSPPPSQQTNILLIRNLVRPFTLNQIKELLSRTGTIVENGFWMDRIKSKCYVEYSNEDQAFETRQALHGISWPPSNPKKLYVEYASKEDMDQARESSKDQSSSRKTELTEPSEIWPQEWGRDEKSNSTAKVTVVREWDLGKEDGQHLVKEKEREKKDIDKKRRQRSRSPGMDAHLPAPARKFKKKEDEPPPAKLLDDLFRKTKATPCIYWLPLTNEQIVVKEEMRRQHMAEHARRLEEMRRAERNRDGRRRRSPRK